MNQLNDSYDHIRDHEDHDQNTINLKHLDELADL